MNKNSTPETSLECSFVNYDHEYERMIDLSIDSSELKTSLNYVLHINPDYLDLNRDEKEKYTKSGLFNDRESRNEQIHASASTLQKFIHTLINVLCSSSFEIYYKNAKDVIAQKEFLKLVDTFIKNNSKNKSQVKNTENILKNDLNSIDTIKKWFETEEESFVNKLISLTPEKQVKKAVEKAREYSRKGLYPKAIEVFNTVKHLLSIPETVSQKYALNKFYLERGLCYKNMGDLEKASADFTQAFNYGNSWAGELLISVYINDFFDYNKALEIAEKLGTFNDYNYNKYSDENYKLINYKGIIQVLRGDQKSAEAIYRIILDDFEIQYPEKITASIKDLNEIVDNNKPNAAGALEILNWFKLNS